MSSPFRSFVLYSVLLATRVGSILAVVIARSAISDGAPLIIPDLFIENGTR